MKQSDLERWVARSTGESRRTIVHYGSSLVEGEMARENAGVAVAVECGGHSRIVLLAATPYHAAESEGGVCGV